MKKLYNYYKDILEKNGYKENAQEVFCGIVSSVDFISDKNIVTLGVQPTDEYDKELSLMKNNEEYTPDFNRMECIYAFFESPVCNVSDYMHGSRCGIIIKAEEGSRYALLDAIGGKEYQKYYPHKMELFEKCLWIQNHISEHEENILKKHLELLQNINTSFKEILKKFDFYPHYSCIFDCNPDSVEANRAGSNLIITFKHRVTKDCIDFSTDCITGEFSFGGISLNEKSIEEILNEVCFIDHRDKDKIKLQYRYLFDKDYTENTAFVIEDAYNAIMYSSNPKEDLKKIDLSLIPSKDYKHLLDEIDKKLKE